MEKPPILLPTPQPAGPLPKGDFQYRNIKAKYFQSLNLGDNASKRSSMQGNSALPPHVPVQPSQHRRARSKTFSSSDSPDVIASRTAAMEIKSSGTPTRDNIRSSGNHGGHPIATAAGGDYFVPFAMSLPVSAHGQATIPASYMPRSALSDRDGEDDIDAELDEVR